MSFDLLHMKSKIESWEKYHQVELLRILVRFNKSKINQNKNGIFVNLSCLQTDVLGELSAYIGFVDEQMQTLQHRECEKEQYKQMLVMPSSSSS